MRSRVLILIICVFSASISCNTKKDRVEVTPTEKKVPSNGTEEVPKTQGNLKISKSQIHIGKIKKGSNVTHEFILSNIGKRM